MLKQRALTATLWSGLDLFLRQGLQLALTITLAHLLRPEDFGVFALLALFTGLALVFVDGGFSAALIQRQDIEHIDESTVFWINLGAAVAMALTLGVGAPLIADFYAQPILIPLARVMACSIVFGALGTIHTALLTKRLDFRTQLQAGGTGMVAAALVAVLLARLGWGVWSLAAQSLVITATTSGILWLRTSWRPRREFSFVSARKLFSFGSYHFAYGMLEIFYARLYTLLIGKIYGVQQLGYYNNADTVRQIPGSFVSSVLSRVIFPMFSQNAGDLSTLRRGMQLAVRGMMWFNAPIMLGMAATAEPFVTAVFGPRWLPTAPVLRVLCFAGLLWPLLALNPYILLAQNKARLMFRIEVMKKSIGVALLGVGSLFGLVGVAWAVVASSLLAFAVNARYTGKDVGYGLGAQLRDLAPIVSAAGVMSGIVYAVSTHWQASPPLALAGLTALGAALFALCALIAGRGSFNDAVATIRLMARRARPTSSDIA